MGLRRPVLRFLAVGGFLGASVLVVWVSWMLSFRVGCYNAVCAEWFAVQVWWFSSFWFWFLVRWWASFEFCFVVVVVWIVWRLGFGGWGFDEFLLLVAL